MNRTPVADWQQLSALYELADTLAPDALVDWLARLRQETHPLLTQLEQMLAARSQIQKNDFLGALPRFPAPPEPRQIEWHADSRIGPYRLLRKIGSGGMAEVWLAQRDDGAFQRQVAIKLLFRHAGSDARDTFAQRFHRERDILASLDHPHIAGLHDAGVTPNGQPWLALEYVEGETLTKWCDARCLTIEARVRLFRQVLLAVQHAHANLVIHRDLKPGNILVTAQGEVRLLDFGIAKLMEPEGGALAETELTRIAGRPMTPQYAAPEQLMGQPLTTACDVYSLGVVLYELMCGDRPYELKVESTAQLEQAILDTEPRAPSRRALIESTATARGTTGQVLRKQLASDLDAIVLRALAKQPAQRYGSVEALRADLDRWLEGEPVEARAPSTAYRLRKFVRRHMLAVGLGSAAVLALVAITVVAVLMGLQAREDSARAGAARDFMLGLFKRADQEKARGADITARELLEAGRKDVLTRMAAQPRLQVELLEGIATIQRDMGEYVGADSTYADAARLYVGLGMPQAAALARVREADTVMRSGDMKLAATLLQRARETPGRRADDHQVNAQAHVVEGWIVFAQRDWAKARDLFSRSHQEALKAFGPYHLTVIDALRGQVYAEQQLRHFDAALQLLDELEVAERKTNDVPPAGFAQLARDRAVLLTVSGQPAAALDVASNALRQCAAELGPNHLACRELAFSKANSMLQLGMAASAVADLPILRAIASDEKSPALGADTAVLILRLTAAAGSAAERDAAFEQLRSLVESTAGAAFGKVFGIKAFLALAESKLRASEPLDAERWIDKAIALQPQSDGAIAASPYAARSRMMQGVAMLQSGRGAQALPILQSAQRDLVQSLGETDPNSLMASLDVALALDGLGRHDEAIGVVDGVEPTLRRTMRETAPTYLRVKALRRRLSGESASPQATADIPPSSSPLASVDFFN